MKLTVPLYLLFAASASMKDQDSSNSSSGSVTSLHDLHVQAAEAVAEAPIVHAMGGAFGSALSLLIFYPLERVRVEMQSRVAAPSSSGSCGSRRRMYSSDGESDQMMQQCEINARCSVFDCLLELHSKGELYRGVSPVMFSLAISNFIFFYSHEAVKKMFISSKTKNVAISAGKALMASTLAGVVNVLLTNPLWVATLRIQTGDKNSDGDVHTSARKSRLFSMIARISLEEGLLKLWSGTAASLVLCSNPAIQLALYERLKRNILSKKGPTTDLSLNMLEAFIIGAVAKGFATVLTYPLQLAQVLLRLQREKRKSPYDSKSEKIPSEITNTGTNESSDREQYKDSIDCLRKLWARGGITAIYSGIDAKLLQTVLTSAFMFLTYEQTLSIFQKAIVAVVIARRKVKS